MGEILKHRFGLGFEVLRNTEEDYQFEDLLDKFCKKLNYKYIKTGDDYCDDPIQYFVVLIDPFSDGLDLTVKAIELRNCLSFHNIKISGNFEVVGGIRRY